MEGFGFLDFFWTMQLDWIVGANLDQGNSYSITRAVQHQRGMLLTHTVSFVLQGSVASIVCRGAFARSIENDSVQAAVRLSELIERREYGAAHIVVLYPRATFA